MPGWLLSAAAVLFTFGLVIFLHELGHFIVCRLLKVHVERFAFGFGPELVGVTTSEGTRLSLCALPLGGFVKPAGESLEDATGAPGEYFSKTWYERLGIVAAGPFMNYFLAFLIFFAVAWARGVQEANPDPVIGELAQGYPAAAAGLEAGDRVLTLDGVPMPTWEELARSIHAKAGVEIELAYERGGERRTLKVTPRLDPASRHGIIGIRQRVEVRRVGPARAASEGLYRCWWWTRYTVLTLAEKIARRERPDLAGPVGIVQMVSEAARSGLENFVLLVGLISVAVGFFNLLPIPLLDGGHAALFVWEGISRRRLTLKTMAVANSVGMLLLVSLLLFATYNDLLRIRDGRRERKARAAAETPAPQPAVP